MLPGAKHPSFNDDIKIGIVENFFASWQGSAEFQNKLIIYLLPKNQQVKSNQQIFWVG